MTKEVKYPLEFKACPACGSERRVVEMIRDQEVEKKKVSPQIKMAAQAVTVPVYDPTRPMLSAPVITAVLDICADCGCYYARFVDVQDQVLQMKPGAMPGQPRPPQGRS